MTDFTKLSPEDLARVTTRDGRKVEIISTKGREPQPVIGYIGKEPTLQSWNIDGRYFLDALECGRDLILPPAPMVLYANGYRGQIIGDYQNAEDARRIRARNWLALYRITDDGVNATIEVIERNKGA